MKLIRRMFLFIAAVLFALSAARYLAAENRAPRDPGGREASLSAEEGYLVRSEGNRVRVTPVGGGRAAYMDGVLVSDLPEADRRQLAEGFRLPDDDALLALLEDYTG